MSYAMKGGIGTAALEITDKKVTLVQAFRMADEVLRQPELAVQESR